MTTKMKLLKIIDILSATDKAHPVTAMTICKILDESGIKAERKSVCRDINTLIEYGYDIKLSADNKLGYYAEAPFCKGVKTVKAEPVKKIGKQIEISLEFAPEDEKAIIDIFGMMKNKVEDKMAVADFKVAESDLFSLLLKAGGKARIIDPEEKAEEFKKAIEELTAFYNKPRTKKKLDVWLL